MLVRKLAGFFNRQDVVPWVFLAPFLVLFLVFKVYPAFYAMFLSVVKMTSLNSAPVFVGASNYAALFKDELFLQSLRITLFYTGGTLLTLIPLPIILAALLQSGWTKGANFHRTILFLPALTSLVVATIVIRFLLNGDGVVNSFLSLFGVPKTEWVNAGVYAVPICIGIAFWRWTGMNIVYFQSGLNNIPKELFEAASIDGATPLDVFWNITLPLLRPIITFVTTITIIGGFQVFVEPYVLFTGSSGLGNSGLTMVLYLYQVAFQRTNFGYASAIGMVLAVIIMIFTVIQLKFSGFFNKED